MKFEDTKIAYALKSDQELFRAYLIQSGKENVYEINAITGAEDFSYFQNEVPGLFFFLGGTPLDMKESEAPSHHTPSFIVDDASMKLGVKALSNLAVDFLKSKQKIPTFYQNPFL